MAYTAEVHARHSLEAELLALQRGVYHANELDAPAIQIEGDCLALITDVQHSATMTWDIMPAWQRTMDMLASLDTWTITYCKHTANGAADLLAKYDLPEIQEERATLPQLIRNAINEDQIRAEEFTRSFQLPPDYQQSSTCHQYGESPIRTFPSGHLQIYYLNPSSQESANIHHQEGTPVNSNHGNTSTTPTEE